MNRMLLVSFQADGRTYLDSAKSHGFLVRVLDCVDHFHRKLAEWYGDAILNVPGRRSDVRTAVQSEQFDVAVIDEDPDFIRTALITQSLREAGVSTIIVVTREAARRNMYRRCGAHRIVVADSAGTAWPSIQSLLPVTVSA